jgi:UDP-3-O-[3-hydroxymyristoyl] glucosamine N-acyltransferase
LFSFSPPLELSELVKEAASRLAADIPGPAPEAPRLSGPGFAVGAVAGAREKAPPGALTFAAEKRHLGPALESGAKGVVTLPELEAEANASGASATLVLFPQPRLLFAAVLNVLEARLRPPMPEGEPSFRDRGSVSIGPGARFGPFCWIGANVSIGARAIIGPYCYIEDECVVGDEAVLHPRVTLRWRSQVGARAVIHSGCVIGGDGFGYTQAPIGLPPGVLHYKNAHLGRAVVSGGAEIGSNSAVDRGMVEDTVIGEGSKLDNLVQIGHNVRVGRAAIVASLAGAAGHASVGDRAVVLGQAGLSHGAAVGDDAILTGQAGATGSIPPGRRAWSGPPARPMEEQLRDQALARRYLPLWRRFLELFRKSESFGELKVRFSEKPGGPEKAESPEKPESPGKTD